MIFLFWNNSKKSLYCLSKMYIFMCGLDLRFLILGFFICFNSTFKNYAAVCSLRLICLVIYIFTFLILLKKIRNDVMFRKNSMEIQQTLKKTFISRRYMSWEVDDCRRYMYGYGFFCLFWKNELLVTIWSIQINRTLTNDKKIWKECILLLIYCAHSFFLM